MSPVGEAHGVLTTGPPGKSQNVCFDYCVLSSLHPNGFFTASSTMHVFLFRFWPHLLPVVGVRVGHLLLGLSYLWG